MTLKFFFGKARKDGTCPLRIRFKANELQDQKITIQGLAIRTNLWDKNLNRVLPEHPAYRDINEKISLYESKMRDVSEKYRVGNIDFDTACRMMRSSSSMISIRDFINQLENLDDKKRTTIVNYHNSINAFSFHTKIKEPLFSDITYINISKMRKSLSELNKSPESHNKYLRDIKAICRSAYKFKMVFELPDFDRSWAAKKSPVNKVKTVLPIDIIEAIERIELNSKHNRSRKKVVKQFEAVGLWMLMFSMRGMYPADINEISSKNLDYNFESRIKAELADSKSELSLRGNPFLYSHQRHKTEIPMKIMLNMPPIRKLIAVLRYLVSASHPKDAFQSQEESQMTSYKKRIQTKTPEEVDHFKIFSFTEESDPERYKEMWNNYYKQLRDIGMPTFKVARKTFMTTSTLLDIPQSIGRTMLGQKDPSISAHYNNFDDPRLFVKVTQAHIKVLREFNTIDIYNIWLGKIDQLFGSNWHEIYGFSMPQDLLYVNFYKEIENMVQITHTKIKTT